MDLLMSSVSQGLLWSIMAIGVYLTYRILDVADLTAEGSFPLGAAICTSLIVNGVAPWLATMAAVIGGMAAGFISGYLHTKWNVPALLSGIITMTGLYSINLRIMGQANLTLLGEETLIRTVQSWGLTSTNAVLVVGLLAAAGVILLLHLFFHTEIGLAIRSTGDNNEMSEANGIRIHAMKIIGFMIGNGLISMSGALLAQNNGYADISMGIGTIVIGLASIIIGEVFFRHVTLAKRLATIVVGSVIYRLLLLLVLEMNVNPQDLKLFSAILLALALGLPAIQSRLPKNKKQRTRKKAKAKGGALSWMQR
ncbi:ABC transporter permease [Atopococcus tabaci]|uniref:ABC transporter permease n=1 Tax=Atopococcus tabaci TaxID=269774 RepID=UPI000426FCFF|nr:ABC transporter permease [Atopococcus tabaci]